MHICEAVQCITLMAWLWVPNELVYVSQTVPVDQNKRSLKKKELSFSSLAHGSQPAVPSTHVLMAHNLYDKSDSCPPI